MTLREAYYAAVASGAVPNNERSYAIFGAGWSAAVQEVKRVDPEFRLSDAPIPEDAEIIVFDTGSFEFPTVKPSSEPRWATCQGVKVKKPKRNRNVGYAYDEHNRLGVMGTVWDVRFDGAVIGKSYAGRPGVHQIIRRHKAGEREFIVISKED